MVWGTEIAWYLFLAGLGSGAFATGVWASWKCPDCRYLQKAAFCIAPIAVAIGLVLLMVDARAGFMHPMRFFLLVSNLESVMSWGVIILGLFMVVALARCACCFANKSCIVWLDAVGVVLSLCTAGYTGVLLGAASQVFPLWNPIVLPILFVVSAASTGTAVAVLGGMAWSRGSESEPFDLKCVHVVLPVVELALIAVLLLVTSGVSGVEASAAGAAGLASVASITKGTYAIAFWIALVVVGLVLPLCANLIEVRLRKRVWNSGPRACSEVVMRKRNVLTLMSASALLVGGFVLRYIIVLGAVAVA